MSEVKQDQQPTTLPHPDEAPLTPASIPGDVSGHVVETPNPLKAVQNELVQVEGPNTPLENPEKPLDSNQFAAPPPKDRIPKIDEGTSFGRYHFIRRMSEIKEAMRKRISKKRETNNPSTIVPTPAEPISISIPTADKNSEEKRKELPNAA